MFIRWARSVPGSHGVAGSARQSLPNALYGNSRSNPWEAALETFRSLAPSAWAPRYSRIPAANALLPMIAPIAMSFLSNNLLGGNQQRQQQYAQQSGAPGLSDLLGGLLGGRQTDRSGNAGGLGIGGLL